MNDPVQVTLSAEDKFFEWMAKTRTGSIFKVTISATIMWALNDITTWNLPPIVMAGGIAFLNMLVNQINPKDDRYGIKGDKVEGGDV